MMSRTLEFLVSVTFSLNVSPQTSTRAPFTLLSQSMSAFTSFRPNPPAHAVVDAASGEDLWAEWPRDCAFDRDAVAVQEPGTESEEVPLRAGGLEDVLGVAPNILSKMMTSSLTAAIPRTPRNTARHPTSPTELRVSRPPLYELMDKLGIKRRK
jgi:hypothetical protein